MSRRKADARTGIGQCSWIRIDWSEPYSYQACELEVAHEGPHQSWAGGTEGSWVPEHPVEQWR
jgi:hypothetical protein